MKLRDRISLAWNVLRYKGGYALEQHARTELDVFFPGSDPMDLAMKRGVLDSIHVFSMQHHSGFSASWARGLLNALLKFEPLGPLTGEDDEWNEVGENMWQNRRCSRVFKERLAEPELKARAYILDHYVFQGPDGMRYTSYNSRKTITFPHYVEEPIIVKVDADRVPTNIKYRRKWEQGV